MGTRSTITLKTGKNRYQSMYCHWDGYLDGNGLILLLGYKNKRKIKKLLELKALSSLHSKMNPRKGIIHDFDNAQRDVCVSYVRDRDENIEIDTYNNIQDIEGEEYDYVFENSQWYVRSYETNGEFIALNKLLIKDENGVYVINPELEDEDVY